MDNNSFYNWKLDIWPESIRMDAAGFWGGDSLAIGLASKGQIRHQAFAIGFFGFHHIRAAVENDPSLRRDSLQILKRLLMPHEIKTVLLKHLNTPKKWSYSDFWKNVLKPISLALGDSLGPETQRMMKLGYWLAAVHSCLVGLLEDNNPGKIAGGLKILEAWMSDLLILAQQAGIPEILLKPLVELAHLLQQSKTPQTALNCVQILKLVMKDLLSSRTMAGLLDDGN